MWIYEEDIVAIPTELFQIANEYLGWGDPHGGVWFVGIEEASEWSEESIHKLKSSVGKKFDPETEFTWLKEPTAKGRGIRNYMSRICASLSDRYGQVNWRKFRDENLWAEGSKVFQTNLYPLGKPAVKDWPSCYKELFGFSREEIEDYKNTVRETRFDMIRQHHKEYSPQATIAFGTSFQKDFLTLFNLKQEDLSELVDKVYFSDKKRIIFCPFFANGHMSNSKADTIAMKLKSWNVKIP